MYYLDDEAELGEIFAAQFEAPGIEITTFTEPDVAIAAIRARPPDVLFLDHRLPSTTGDEIARKLNPACPTALITGEIDPRPTYPFVRVFQKPWPEDEIAALIAGCRHAGQDPA